MTRLERQTKNLSSTTAIETFLDTVWRTQGFAFEQSLRTSFANGDYTLREYKESRKLIERQSAKGKKGKTK